MKQSLHFFLFTGMLGALLLLSTAASAQVEHKTRNQQRQELRKSLREAQKVESEYRESHLNLANHSFKDGESSRKRSKKKEARDRMEIKEDGTAAKPDVPVKKRKKAKKK
jgi:Flp pilus assembly protein TadB